MLVEKPAPQSYWRARDLSRWSQYLVLAIGICAILLMSIIVTWRVENSREADLQSATLSNQDRVSVFQAFVSRSFDYLERATENLSEDLGSSSNIQTSYSPSTEKIIGHLVTDRSAQVIFASVELDAASEMAISEYIRAQNGRGFLSPPFESSTGSRFLIFGSAELDSAAGPPTFLLISPEYFLTFAEGLHFAEGDLISLIGLDGITRARRTENQISSGEDLGGKLVMERQLSNPNITYSGPNGLTGELSVFSHRRIEEYGVFATSGLTIERVQAMTSARTRFLWFMLLIASVIVVIAALAVLRSFQKQYSQLKLLERNVGRLRESQVIGGIGDWDYDTDLKTFEVSDVLQDVYGLAGPGSYTFLEFTHALTERSVKDLHLAMNEVQVFREPRYAELRLHGDQKDHVFREVTIGPVFSPDGGVIGLHAVDRDVSREKRIGALRARLSVLSRLDAMSALAATIAHEISQPLSAARSLISAARKTLSDGNQTKADELLESSYEQMRFMSDIISNARQELRSWGGADQSFELAEAITSTEELLKNFYENRRFEINFHAVKGAEFARGALSQAKQIFFNLFKNSIEATPDTQACVIEITAQPHSDDMIKVTLKDNGRGFGSEADPFELFATTKKDGLGIGMALTKTVVEALGGMIWIERSKRSGATICFTLDASSIEDELLPRKLG